MNGVIPTIICAYNEANNIFELVNCLNNLQYGSKRLGVVVVDDGSTDNTAYLAMKAGAKKVISFKKNCGKATAFFYGLNYIVKNFSEQLLLSFDGDVQKVENQQVKLLLDPFSDSRVMMTIGSVNGIANTSFLSGQRGYRICSIKKIVEDRRYISSLSRDNDKRLGYGLEVLLNYTVTGLQELFLPFHPNWGVRFADTDIECKSGLVESKYRNKLKADDEIERTRNLIKELTTHP